MAPGLRSDAPKSAAISGAGYVVVIAELSAKSQSVIYATEVVEIAVADGYVVVTEPLGAVNKRERTIVGEPCTAVAGRTAIAKAITALAAFAFASGGGYSRIFSLTWVNRRWV